MHTSSALGKSSLFKSVCVFLHASEVLAGATRPAPVPPVPQLGSWTQYGACKLKLNSLKTRSHIDDTSRTGDRIAHNRSKCTQTDRQRIMGKFLFETQTYSADSNSQDASV